MHWVHPPAGNVIARTTTRILVGVPVLRCSSMIELLRERVELLRRVAAEQAIPVVIGEPVPVPRDPALPAALHDVFDIVGTVDTGDLRFAPPVAGPVDEQDAQECPLGLPPAIGEGYVVTGETADDVIAIGNISLDPFDGSVYYIDADSYWFYRIDGYAIEEIEVNEFAPDIVAFFTEYVFGPGYPVLADVVCNCRPYQTRKHRYAAPWMRLLVEAGLLDPPSRERPRQWPPPTPELFRVALKPRRNTV